MMRRALAVLGGGLLAAACSQSTNLTFIQNLQRPNDVSFGCIQLFVADGGVAGQTASSLANCGTIVPSVPSLPGPDAAVMDGDAGVDAGVITQNPIVQVALISEQVRSVVWLVDLNQTDPTTQNIVNRLVDSDPFAPGQNPLPVGPLPVGVVTEADGCFAATANAGSCDLSVINILNADLARPNAVNRLPLTNSAGPFLAKPAAILGPAAIPRQEQNITDPARCQSPQGPVYVAYPQCALMARIDLATGAVLDGVQFHDGGPPTLVGPDVSCPVECPQAGVPATPAPVTNAPQPAVLAMERDGSRIYVGSGNSGDLAIVSIDSTGRPTAIQSLSLEGAQGIRRISASGDINWLENNQLPNPDPTNPPPPFLTLAGPFRFLYIVDSDGTVHVVEVNAGAPAVECDTQIDRRFLHGETNLNRLACFKLGDPTNPPRRADARGPGIRLPKDIQPLDVGFFNSPVTAITEIEPLNLQGSFALISAVGPLDDPSFGRGVLFYVNIFDANYPATESGTVNGAMDTAPLGDPTNHDIGLSIPHALRDDITQRFTASPGPCFGDALSDTVGAERIDGSPARPVTYVYNDGPSPAGSAFAPSLHRISCSGTAATWSLDFSAPPEVRAPLFPDLEKTGVRTTLNQITADEGILVSWQGPLADTSVDSRKSGANVIVDQGGLTIETPGALLCNLGVQVGDILALIGCTADTDCGLGEVCVVHPDAPAVATGMCVAAAQRDQVLTACQSALTSRREYSVLEAGDDHTIVVPRPDILIGSPIDGCSDAVQCSEIDALLHPPPVGSSAGPHTFSCAGDPVMGGPARCIYSCTADADCLAGSVCDVPTSRCILGPVDIAPSCVLPAQRYEYRAGDAFSVISSQDEYGSRERVDPGSGLCVPDTSLSPLVVNRFHRIEPPCTDLSVTGIAPNPCSIPDLTEPVPSASGTTFDQRPAFGIRIRSVGITLDVTDVAIPLLNPQNLPELMGVRYSPIGDDYQMSIAIAGGFSPAFAGLDAALPQRLKIGPDSTLWVIDSGINSPLLRNGQVIPVVFGLVSANLAIF